MFIVTVGYLFTIDILIVLVCLLSAHNAIVLAMRMLVGHVMVLVERYTAIIDGAFIIIAWVGLKLLIEYLHGEGWIPFAIPQWASLVLIVSIFIVSLLYARRHPSAQTHAKPE